MPHPLGRKATRHDDRTLQLARYLTTGGLPTPPSSVDWAAKLKKAKGGAPFGVMLNDRLGCCAIAAPGHKRQIDSALDGKEVTPTDAQILKAYEDVGGYRPGDASTDNGCVMLDVLNYWRKTGIGGAKILGYVKLAVGNWNQLQQAIALFGGAYIGWNLPMSAQSQVGGVWTLGKGAKAKPGSWGGHATWGDGYDQDGKTITWGLQQGYAPDFYRAYGEETYAVISEDWIGTNGLDPNKLDLATLSADLKLITGTGL